MNSLYFTNVQHNKNVLTQFAYTNNLTQSSVETDLSYEYSRHMTANAFHNITTIHGIQNCQHFPQYSSQLTFLRHKYNFSFETANEPLCLINLGNSLFEVNLILYF